VGEGAGRRRARWRGYGHDSYRHRLRAPGITPRIARRGVAHGSGLGQQRWVVERSFAWLHAFKRLRTRYERRADIPLGLLQTGLRPHLLSPARRRSEMSS
jgi:transposase